MRPRARSAALLMVATLAATTFLSTATADHAYSHRYIIFGRLVDADNNPVVGLTVDMGFDETFEPEGTCANQPDTDTEAYGPTRSVPVTNEFGDFMFCFHVHGLSRVRPPVGIFRVPSLEFTEEFEFDTFTRHSFLKVKLPEAHPDADAEILDTAYTIHGTVWRPASGREEGVEGIRVFGDTIDMEPVNLTVAFDGVDPIAVTTRTNNYGDFAVRVPVDARPTGGTITARVAGQTFQMPVDPETGVSSQTFEMPEVSDPFVRNALVVAGVVVAVGAVGGGGWYGIRRWTEARQVAQARSRSGRKRANK